MFRGREASARAGGDVENEAGILGSDALHDIAVVRKLHGRLPGRGLADVDVDDRSAGLAAPKQACAICSGVIGRYGVISGKV